MNKPIIALALALALAACGHSEPRPSTTATTSAQVVSNEVAITNLTTARCKHEQSCGNIGEDGHWGSLDGCTRELGDDTRSALQAKECPNGVGQSELAGCINEMHAQRCDNALDALARALACRKSKLCR
jgi:hypothetical protein